MNQQKKGIGYGAVIALALIFLVVGGLIGYYISPSKVVEVPGREEVKTETLTVTGPVSEKKLKAAFIYVGPIGDYGWSHAHDQGRLYVGDKFPWLETVYAEAVAEADADRYIDRFVQEGADVVFTTSFGFMDATITVAEKYPEKIFMHCSGYKRSKNVGTYFADFYQLYYLNGLMAGALTKTNKLGYVAAHTIPEVVRHINAFTLGAKEANPDITVSVRVINSWYDPTKARQATESLIAEGCDAIAFTEDSPTVLEVGQEYTEKGQQIYTFSHYSPMQDFGPDTCVSGQLVHWELLYEEILMRIYLDTWSNRDYLWNLKEGGVELGGKFGEPVNQKFIPDLKAKKIVDPILGDVTIYDLIMHRLEEMSEPSILFDPYTGPIKDQDGNIKIEAGRRATYSEMWNINWYVEGVIGIEEIK